MIDIAQAQAWLATNKDWVETLSYFAAILGIVALLITYIGNIRAEAQRREVGTYESLEAQYVEFQKLAIKYIDLDVADYPLGIDNPLTPQQKVQQRTLYMVLFSLFEHAYVMYKPRGFGALFGRRFMNAMRRQQWAGWQNYIDKYLRRPPCQAAWNGEGLPEDCVDQDFDQDFENYIKRRMRELSKAG